MVAETRLLLDAPECVQHGDKLRPKSRRVMLRVVAILAVGCRSVEEGNARTSQRHNQGCRELGRTSGSDWVGEPWTFCENLPKFDSRRVLSDCVGERSTFCQNSAEIFKLLNVACGGSFQKLREYIITNVYTT